MSYNRRSFIAFLGKATLGAAVAPPFLMGCGQNKNPNTLQLDADALAALKRLPLKNIAASDVDDLLLTEGLDYQLVVKWGDAITGNDTFGYNNDFTCFIPFDDANPDDGLLWVNHEYINGLFVSGYNRRDPKAVRTKAQVDQEMYNVGGSIVRVKKTNDQWRVVENDPHNRRITGHTPIPFNWDQPIMGKRTAIGTLSNCSGGITPWRTFLTCEENYDDCYGETVYDANNQPSHVRSKYQGWEDFYNHPPEHYGWVVEVDPKDGSAQKHIALGRFAHECCTLKQLEDDRIVAYSGDDQNDGCLYKFIGSTPNSLKEGTLYVADTVNGQWLSLDWASQPVLQQHFKDQTEVLVRTREAALLVGGTQLNRPEDIEIDPVSGGVFISLTNNKPKGDFHGSILKLEETSGAYDGHSFTASTYKAGGEAEGFTCPDNLAFDHAGNLWMTSDMSGSAMHNENQPYMAFKNNSLYVIPRYGDDAGKVIRVISAPRDAELTGPWFAPDGKTLFLSVQHPGEQTQSLDAPTSLWPFDDDRIPKSAVVAIQGPLIEKLNQLQKLTS